MIKYLHNFKKYNIDLLGNYKVFEKRKTPSNIIPEESVCIDCQTPLSNPVKVCDNVRVLTMQGMVTGFKSYVKNAVFVNYIIDSKVGTMVYIIITTVYFWDLTYVYILKNIYTITIQYYRLVNL